MVDLWTNLARAVPYEYSHASHLDLDLNHLSGSMKSRKLTDLRALARQPGSGLPEFTHRGERTARLFGNEAQGEPVVSPVAREVAHGR